MPDISMCPGEGCPKKESCYRYLAEPDQWRQAYFTTPPVKEDGTCDYYWKHNTTVMENLKAKIEEAVAYMKQKNNDTRRTDRETS